MRRIILAFAGAVVFSLLAPVRSDAAVIQCFDSSDPSCTAIGLFSWLPGSLDDDVFTLTNNSDTSSLLPGGGDAFENVSLIVDATIDGFPPDPIAPGGQVDSQGTGFFFLTTSAHLEFTFRSSPFVLDLSGIDEVPILAQTVVTEPATLLLFGTGLAVSRFIRRRRR